MRAFCLFIFLAAINLACTETSTSDAEIPPQDSLVVELSNEMSLLEDSIKRLQSLLVLAEAERRQNDSLQQLVTTLINSRNPQQEMHVAETSVGLEKLNKSLPRQRDSLMAASKKVEKVLAELRTVAIQRQTAVKSNDSLTQLNSTLTTQLGALKKKLAEVSQQKRRDSLTLRSSSGSAAAQQKELTALMSQRDSLAHTNNTLSKKALAYEKSLQQLKQQKKADSLRLASNSTLPAANNAEQNSQDSLRQMTVSLTRQLAAQEQAIARLYQQKKKDSLLLATSYSPLVSVPSSQSTAEIAAFQSEIDSLKTRLALLSRNTEITQATIPQPADLLPNKSVESPPDSMATVRRWAATGKANTDLREGFRLLLLAQQAEKTDPTLSLKLLREALRYSDDSLILKETKRVYDSYFFYETMVQKRRAVRSISLNESYLALNLANDSAYLFQGIDSVLTQVQAFSKVSALALPPQAYLFTGHPTGQVSMYNLSSGKQQSKFKAHDQRVTALGFIGKNETFIATGAADKVIYLWTNKFEKANRLVGLHSSVSNIDVSRGLLIAGASGDLAPRLWNTDGKLLLNLTGHKDSVYSMDISDNARYLLTTSRDRTAQIWDLKGNFVRVIGGHRAALAHGIFSHNQRLVALASVDGSISLWNFNGAALGKLTGHGQQVNQLIFDKTDTYLYSCSDDGTVRRWLIKKPKELDLSILPPMTNKERAGLSVLK